MVRHCSLRSTIIPTNHKPITEPNQKTKRTTSTFEDKFDIVRNDSMYMYRMLWATTKEKTTNSTERIPLFLKTLINDRRCSLDWPGKSGTIAIIHMMSNIAIALISPKAPCQPNTRPQLSIPGFDAAANIASRHAF